MRQFVNFSFHRKVVYLIIIYVHERLICIKIAVLITRWLNNFTDFCTAYLNFVCQLSYSEISRTLVYPVVFNKC